MANKIVATVELVANVLTWRSGVLNVKSAAQSTTAQSGAVLIGTADGLKRGGTPQDSVSLNAAGVVKLAAMSDKAYSAAMTARKLTVYAGKRGRKPAAILTLSDLRKRTVKSAPKTARKPRATVSTATPTVEA